MLLVGISLLISFKPATPIDSVYSAVRCPKDPFGETHGWIGI
jgi:hypothetical protein